MATFTQLEGPDVQEIADSYDLTVDEYSPIRGGNGNSSYLLKTQLGKFVLTVCDDKVFDEVAILGRLLLLLEENNFPSNRLVPLVNKEILASYLEKPVMLKVFIEGEVVEGLSRPMLFQVGSETARLHQIPVPDYLPDDHPYGRKCFQKVLGLGIDSTFESWLTQQLQEFDRDIRPDLPRGLIHGDLFFDNLLFDAGKFKAIIDFEEACQYFKVFDLGMGIVGTCADSTSIDFSKARSLVKGYEQVRRLEHIEKESLQMFVQYAATATSFWRFHKYNIETPTADRRDHHGQMVELAEAVKNVPKLRFMDAIFN
jgi:homoserine kinase type II